LLISLDERTILTEFMDATILWRIRGYILSATALTLIAFGSIGFALDTLFGTKPKLLIALIVLSFPVSNFIAIRLTKSKLTPPNA
jgi:F0F1-type ATP synthase assembly protein I